MAQIPTEYRAATPEEFDAFVAFIDSENGWKVCWENKEKTVRVWEQPSDKSSINIVRLWTVYDDIDALTLYDVLHDPDYRREWDENMIEGYNIEQIDANNDVGYYSAKIGFGVANRDFVNERSWRVKEDKEYLIMNHSVVHPKAPEKKGFVRANSIQTGYLVRTQEKGATLAYVTQTDPRGWIPSMVINSVTKQFAPKIVDKLGNAARKYAEWKAQHNPDHRPWRGMVSPNVTTSNAN
mmetsp:Transcript_4339/g.6080  ORF Transcript_4339/g.6080 Transcript_4339/m.6080 type:complete len:238 (-) Transcript_4339:69-782(-)